MPSDLIRGWAPVRGKDASRAKYGQFRHDRGCPALTTQASQGRVIGIRIRPANALSRRDEYHSQNDRLNPGRRCRLRNARSADISASFRSRSGRRTRPRLCPGRIGVRSGLRPQPLGDGGDFRRPDRPARNPAALDAGKAREARRFCRRYHGHLRGPRTRRRRRLGDQARVDPTWERPDTKIPAGTRPARIDRNTLFVSR